MNEGEIGALMFVASILNELEETKRRGGREVPAAGKKPPAAPAAAREIAERIEALRVERVELLRRWESARSWAAAWKSIAKHDRERLAFERSARAELADRVRRATAERDRCREDRAVLPEEAIDAFLQYRNEYGYDDRRAKVRALRRFRRQEAGD